jgi:hypothetical protein
MVTLLLVYSVSNGSVEINKGFSNFVTRNIISLLNFYLYEGEGHL